MPARLEIRPSFCNEIAAEAVGLTGGVTVRVRDWMKHPVHTVKPRDSIAHARALLEEHRINQLPVIVNGNVVGIVTDRDLRDAFPSVFDAPGFTGGPPRKPGRDPDEVRVDMVTTRRGRTLEVRVHPEDLGKVIGRGGRTATSLRTIVNAIGGRGVRVDVVDTDR